MLKTGDALGGWSLSGMSESRIAPDSLEDFGTSFVGLGASGFDKIGFYEVGFIASNLAFANYSDCFCCSSFFITAAELFDYGRALKLS